MASLVLSKTLRVRPGEAVTIETWSGTLPWATAFVLEARRMGARPVLLYEDEETYWKSVASADPKVLGTPGRHEWALLERTNAYVFFWGPGDLAREMRLPEKTRELLGAYDDRWFATAERVGLRMARLYLGRMTAASAPIYGVDADAVQRELVDAALVDPEPMHRMGLRVAERLREGTELHIEHPNGTDLSLRLKHRPPILQTGIFDGLTAKKGGRIPSHPGLLEATVPAGYVFVALDEGFAEGRFVSDRPSFLELTRLRGGIWEFRNGRLIHYSYLDGRDAFDRAYAAAGPGRDLPGMITIGLNPKIRHAPLMEDQALGTVTLNIGANRYAGGTTETKNWFKPWLLLRGADVAIDGKPLVKHGKVL